jgi:hypothetical protein
MSQVPGMLNGLGDLQSKLQGALLAADGGSGSRSGVLPRSTYANLTKAVGLLVTATDYLPGNPDAARARYVDAQRLFQAEERTCVDNNPDYCSRFGVERFAEIFRTESVRILHAIDNPQRPVPPSKHDLPSASIRPGQWNWANWTLLGFAALGGFIVLRGLFKGATAVGAGAAAGTRAARDVIKA